MKKIFSILLAAIAMAILSGCISNVTLKEMDMESDVSFSGILNLKLVGGEEVQDDNKERIWTHYKKVSTSDDISIFNMETRLLKGYFDENEPQYGYAVLEYESERIQGEMRLLAIAMVTIPLYFLGFPANSAKFNLHASFSIYDSYGNLVKKYSKTDEFYQVAGFYYGHNPTKRASKRFSRMFTELFKLAVSQRQIINKTLLAAGPITPQKDVDAIAKILSKSESSEKSSEGYYYSGSSSNDSVSESINTSIKTLEKGMKNLNKNIMNDLKNRQCSSCRGNGNCPNCGGTGKNSGNQCFSCHGSGVCTRCNGTGKGA